LKDPTAAAAYADRLPEDFARDACSRPGEVLAFIGIERGMCVLDFNTATGYYAELLARTVGPGGHVVAHNHPGARAALARGEIERRYAGGRLANVQQLFAAHDALALAPGSLDAALMATVYHDTYWYDPAVNWGPVDRERMLLALREMLAPGGLVGVIDHYARPAEDPRRSAMEAHRIDPDVVLSDFRGAGFALEAQCDVLRNVADDRTKSVFDDAIRGRTDRFVMRFRRMD
jgi:predicted methyltransferase